MITIVFEFLDTSRGQSGPFGLAALGMPDCWMDALIGDGYIEHRDYIAPGILRRVVARFPTRDHRDQFACSVRQVSKLLGTYAFRGTAGVGDRRFQKD
ncbi:hypothetical protein [Paraburkholderia tuberum]|uniref:Uncharacterized protein n=1 Tax=Paraburkholderia tuberum TaxID=157910 RepID=A0A1H1KKE8_9BURK|nr:hypothetical protein [Paraburkholderia tuberum]SDR62831.1 hypothetical protein SAMN05445850_8455 [Paraburkholderia tuberum]